MEVVGCVGVVRVYHRWWLSVKRRGKRGHYYCRFPHLPHSPFPFFHHPFHVTTFRIATLQFCPHPFLRQYTADLSAYDMYDRTTPQLERSSCRTYNKISLLIPNLEAEPSTSVKKLKTRAQYMDYQYGMRCRLSSGLLKDMELAGDGVDYSPGNACQPITDPSLVCITHLWWIRELTDILWNHWT